MKYEIENHRLKGVFFEQSPNISKGKIVPKFIVIHYTGADNIDSTYYWFQRPDAKVSAHLIVGKQREVIQMAEFNQRAWHCGKSEYAGMKNLNSHAIGIEFVNTGPGPKKQYWDQYTNFQLETLRNLIPALIKAYPTIKYFVGHEEISPGRKIDPGPAFPMTLMKEHFRKSMGIKLV